jgi:hypothetical protein
VTANPSFRGDTEHRTWNLEIPGLALARHPENDSLFELGFTARGDYIAPTTFGTD